MIAGSNTKGILKSKDKMSNRWCCHHPYQTPTKVLIWRCLKVWRWGHLIGELSILSLKRWRSSW